MIKFNNERTFGVEIEFVSKDNANRLVVELMSRGLKVQKVPYGCSVPSGHWKVTTDSSVEPNGSQIRRGYCGRGLELVSPILKGQEGIEALRLACEALEASESEVNASAGLHVHHGTDDLTVENFKNVHRIYSRFEGTFDSMMPNSRRRNNKHLIKSLRGLDYYKPAFARAESIDQFLNVNEDRYYKLNFQSYRTHSTIEFRHHSGTVEFAKIKHWVYFTQAIIERSHKAVQDKDYNESSDRWLRLVDQIFGNKAKDAEMGEAIKHFRKRIKKLAS